MALGMSRLFRHNNKFTASRNIIGGQRAKADDGPRDDKRCRRLLTVESRWPATSGDGWSSHLSLRLGDCHACGCDRGIKRPHRLGEISLIPGVDHSLRRIGLSLKSIEQIT
jgi:hypothetical protein